VKKGKLKEAVKWWINDATN